EAVRKCRIAATSRGNDATVVLRRAIFGFELGLQLDDAARKVGRWSVLERDATGATIAKAQAYADRNPDVDCGPRANWQLGNERVPTVASRLTAVLRVVGGLAEVEASRAERRDALRFWL